MKVWKKRIPKIASLLFVITLFIAGSTFSYMMSSDKKTNTFSPGTLRTDIVENSDPAGDSTSKVIVPNDKTAQKIVTVKNILNDHAIDAYIRVALVPSWVVNGENRMNDFTPQPLNTADDKLVLGKDPAKAITLNLNPDWNNDWVYKDGYFYHRAIVTPGHETEPLLQSVTVNHANDWSNLQIEVLSDSIQAGGNAVAGIAAWNNAVKIDSSNKLVLNS